MGKIFANNIFNKGTILKLNPKYTKNSYSSTTTKNLI